jgi:hypothetical protein
MDVKAGKSLDLYAWTAPHQENSRGKTKFPAASPHRIFNSYFNFFLCRPKLRKPAFYTLDQNDKNSCFLLC